MEMKYENFFYLKIQLLKWIKFTIDLKPNKHCKLF
jgi:hypothetical protein